jgi:hypothetical protein
LLTSKIPTPAKSRIMVTIDRIYKAQIAKKRIIFLLSDWFIDAWYCMCRMYMAKMAE